MNAAPRAAKSSGAEAMASSIERLAKFSDGDLDDLCEATKEAIVDGEGFGWLRPPPSHKLEAYWRGVLMVPERELFVARLDGTIVGTVQLIKPPPNNEAGAFAAEISTFFVAPWARGYGLARGLLKEAEKSARRQKLKVLDLMVRADRSAAIALFENAGFSRWAEKERYALVGGKYVAGYGYTKNLNGRRPAAKRGTSKSRQRGHAG